ncbi:MAG: FG-GAP repeat protein [Treponema sp.]|nr:FG-GAP repeat protein [Treponema sp.]MBR3548860.1 FG-GAP repeat protein [Treponema sp.]MBR4247242.1 FG-GAP repeat protein [Treponema sp.]MBR4385126.1 FG-GAP repeat protein [Treponema sp.]MBR6143427.1 FG-GAP repeat protein [Treponema sp.]
MIKKIFATIACAAMLTAAVSAQKEYDVNLFPEYWGGVSSIKLESDCIMEGGDFNKDGFSDLIVIATPKDPDFMRTREDGYVYNFNKPVMAIFLGQENDRYKLFKEYKNTIPGNDEENEDCFHETEISVSKKGVITISVGEFYSAGSSDSPKTEYLFRFQKGDFFLIGKNYGSFSRYSGDAQKVSENYLARKKQTVTYNMFDDSVPEKETWTKLPSAPLVKLGEKLLTAYDE